MSRTLALVVILTGSSCVIAEAPRIISLHTQRQNGATYFAVVVRPPRDLRMPRVDHNDLSARHEGERRRLARLPQLVPQDENAFSVYSALDLPLDGRSEPSLHFVGKVRRSGKANFVLAYPTEANATEANKNTLLPQLAKQGWDTTDLTLDFETATPHSDNLENQWARAQARYFAVWETQTSDFAFFGMARTLTGRKYHVPASSYGVEKARSSEFVTRQLFEMTTGSAAVTASLALERMRHPGERDRGERSVAVGKVPGIEVAEHPWLKMMGDKKPEPEPLANLTPHDFYFFSFRGLGTLLDFGDLLDQWGGNLLKGYEISSRDYHARERYEKQLCLGRTELARTLGPALVRGVALVGSDVYLREGSDVSLIFHVTDRRLFLAAVEPFLRATRQEFGARLQESKPDYQGIVIESFVTPHREVSLHRAAVGEFVIYANSPAALRRILDVQAGRGKALAQALDFQYMRTVFRKGEKSEDGFAFLSDAFIRQLVGPASKIKEKRRLEALTSLRMLTDAALFVAWETGKLPNDRASVLTASGLKADEIDVPEGGAIVWDNERQTAHSDAYNTLAFATPLIELPIDAVTPREASEYGLFRQEYLGLWRRYFDPVGMRLSLADKRVRIETYVLPLIDDSGYNGLRMLTGEGTTKLDMSSLSTRTLAQFTINAQPLQKWIDHNHPGALGDQLFVRWDDSPKYRELMELWVRHDYEPGDEQNWDLRLIRMSWQLPVTVGMRINKKEAFDGFLQELGKMLTGEGSTLTPAYRGVSIRRVHFDPKGNLGQFLNPEGTPPKERFVPTLYHAHVEGFWYVSTSLESLRDIIDRAVTARERTLKETEKVELNSSLFLAPEAMFSAAEAFRGYLEWESHRRAVANGPILHVLRRAGVLDGNRFDGPEARQTALRFFGFVPVSPDGSAYQYSKRCDGVESVGYGSLWEPKLGRTLPANSPLARLLDQMRTVRADLRFREDGIHTVLTLDRRAVKK